METENGIKIAIDCFKQIKGVGKSIGIYNLALNLIKNLVRYKDNTSDTKVKNAELIVIGNKYNKDDFDIPGVKFICVRKYNPMNKSHCVIWELFSVSHLCKKINIDKVIFPRGFCAITHPVNDIIIVHDLIPFYYHEKFPDVFNRIENAYIMNRLRRSIQTCHKVITISEASKKDIMKYCSVNERKISVIHNGCNEINFQTISEKHKRPYICAITSMLPHKNAIGIFESYRKYCEISQNPIDLRVIGVENVNNFELPENIEKKITCYKFIKKNDELYKIIAESKVFLFLSLSEGFGFPPIEAMQLKVPVICSNCSSLPEIVNNAAVLVDPCNPESVAIELDNLISDKKRIADLVAKGEQNIRRFSWDSRARLYWKNILE